MRFDSVNQKIKGFTLIEIIVVVFIIGLLSGIIMVGYNNYRSNAAVAQIKSDLSGASTVMENARNFNNSYPSSVPSTFDPSSGVTLSGGGSTDGKTYCIDEYINSSPSIRYYITNTSTNPQLGGCVTGVGSIAGSVILGSTLTAGSISPAGSTVSYQWQNSTTPSGTFSNIAGATNSTYVVAAGDIGKYIRVLVNGTGNYVGTQTTSSTGTIALDCPTGFIVVPGNSIYGTSDFCVMKYEAKITGNVNGNQTYSSAFVPESRVTGTPWVNITQPLAIVESQTVCTGCHLITDAEWLTIASNALSLSSNWQGGQVGSGYIYSGHNDNAPANSLAAAVDSDPYNGTGQTSPSNQKRTLTLTNGEVIWDLAGNVSEFTASRTGSQPGGVSGWAWREWTAVADSNLLSPNPSPVTTGITGSNLWDSWKGIGKLYSSSTAANSNPDTYVLLRGGPFNVASSGAGVLSLNLSYGQASINISAGFRVAK